MNRNTYYSQLNPYEEKLLNYYKFVGGAEGTFNGANALVARMTGMSIKTVIKYRRKLEKMGYIIVEHQKNDLGGDSTVLVKIVEQK